MNSTDWAWAIASATIVALALVILAAWVVKSDYSVSGSFRIAKRNAPRPKSPSGTAPASVTEIGRAS